MNTLADLKGKQITFQLMMRHMIRNDYDAADRQAVARSLREVVRDIERIERRILGTRMMSWISATSGDQVIKQILGGQKGNDGGTGTDAQFIRGRGVAPRSPLPDNRKGTKMKCKRKTVVWYAVVGAVVFLLGIGTAVLFSGCSTVAGIGADLQGASQGIAGQFNANQ